MKSQTCASQDHARESDEGAADRTRVSHAPNQNAEDLVQQAQVCSEVQRRANESLKNSQSCARGIQTPQVPSRATERQHNYQHDPNIVKLDGRMMSHMWASSPQNMESTVRQANWIPFARSDERLGMATEASVVPHPCAETRMKIEHPSIGSANGSLQPCPEFDPQDQRTTKCLPSEPDRKGLHGMHERAVHQVSDHTQAQAQECAPPTGQRGRSLKTAAHCPVAHQGFMILGSFKPWSTPVQSLRMRLPVRM